MSWFYRLLHPEPPRVESVLSSDDRDALARAKATETDLRGRTDDALQRAQAFDDYRALDRLIEARTRLRVRARGGS